MSERCARCGGTGRLRHELAPAPNNGPLIDLDTAESERRVLEFYLNKEATNE